MQKKSVSFIGLLPAGNSKAHANYWWCVKYAHYAL